MDERFCEKCEQELFNAANPILCEQCAERFFDIVKDYIGENPENSLDKVVEETGVAKKYIKKWIRAGRIQYKSREEEERSKKLENFKRDYDKMVTEEKSREQTEANKKKDNKGRYHTRD
ncbi:hypothetical protein [Natranaerobius thermophilus]|uniref:Uncharacterized protein n=1 Tax=Natranaerobius thermophilus (strain ATCC BAA-1301 / DSM 18059 / JW/NM-WN-LF) TaxID=457570 RepID=B2A2D0_NATTJ|nr:hypothetical protein [Natranaerobius thermophilus]ACB86236.1 hypothetical protein Nther_2681 [Natranaerobius thermophilus JW/NM-WN-LF]